MEKKKVRNTNIEIMRFLLMAAILLWHVIVHGYDMMHIGYEGWVTNANIPISLFLATLTLPATYCFVLISGYYGLRFNIKRFVELLIWCVIVSVGLLIGQRYIYGIDFSLKELWQSFFPITSGKWWFMTAYIQLWILSPFLNQGVEVLDKKNLVALIAIIYCVSIFHMFIADTSAGSSLFGLLFIYLLGRYLKMYGFECIEKRPWIYLLCFVIFFGLMFTAYEILPMIGLERAQRYIFTFMGFSNPLIVVMAVCIFYFFCNLPAWENKKLNALLAPNLFIYLITEGMVGGVIYVKIANMFDTNSLAAIGLFFLVLLGCLFIGQIVQSVVRLVIKMTAQVWS